MGQKPRPKHERTLANHGEGKSDPQHEVDAILEAMLTDVSGDGEELWALYQALEDHVKLPADAFVIGEPIEVSRFEYDGNERRGLMAVCSRSDGASYPVALADVRFAPNSAGSLYVAAYRRWMGATPLFLEEARATPARRSHKVKANELDLDAPIELIVLSTKEKVARCRVPGSGRAITLRTSGVWNLVPGAIATVRPKKQWSYGGHPYLSGDIESTVIDATRLGVAGLKLEDMGMWDPKEHYWGEDDEPLDDWAQTIFATGPRPSFEILQPLPGDPDDEYSWDIVVDAMELRDAGDLAGANQLLMKLCETNLRHLDAHAHLGNLSFEHFPKYAIRHYEVGLRIGELSLDAAANCVLEWGHLGNRPFLRCMHGYGLCLWRLGRFDAAACVFDRMLWLNPGDNQGVRFLIDDVRAGVPWEDRQD